MLPGTTTERAPAVGSAVQVPAHLDHELFAIWLRSYRARFELTRRQGAAVRAEMTRSIARQRHLRDQLHQTLLESRQRAAARIWRTALAPPTAQGVAEELSCGRR